MVRRTESPTWRSLTLAEAATLGAVTNGPSLYDPIRHPVTFAEAGRGDGTLAIAITPAQRRYGEYWIEGREPEVKFDLARALPVSILF